MTAGMPTARAGCGVRPSPPAPMRRPPSSPRHDSRPPRPPAVGRRCCSGAAAADLRGRPARVSHLPRRDADRRIHHADVGDRPDPHPPPHPRDARGPRQRAASPIDPGTGRAWRPATPRGGTPGPLNITPIPRPRRGRSAWAAVPPGPPIGPRRPRDTRQDLSPDDQRGTPAWRRSPPRSPAATRMLGDRAVYSTDPRPTSIEIPIPSTCRVAVASWINRGVASR